MHCVVISCYLRLYYINYSNYIDLKWRIKSIRSIRGTVHCALFLACWSARGAGSVQGRQENYTWKMWSQHAYHMHAKQIFGIDLKPVHTRRISSRKMCLTTFHSDGIMTIPISVGRRALLMIYWLVWGPEAWRWKVACGLNAKVWMATCVCQVASTSSSQF